jgi:hypothetical protein
MSVPGVILYLPLPLYQCDSDEMEAERMAEDEVHSKQVGIVGRRVPFKPPFKCRHLSFCWASRAAAQLSRIVPDGTEETGGSCRQRREPEMAASSF